MKGKDNAAVQYQEEKKIKIVQYQPDDSINLDVRFEDGAVWLTQAQMVTLFERERTVISKHIRNIFAEGELDEESNVHFLHIPSSYKPVKAYSSDVINSVGRRVRSHRTASFLKWAEATAKDAIKPCNEEKKGEIIVYQPDNSLKLDVLLENETVWLTQSQMAYLFQSTKQNIGMHINNAFKEGELEPDSVVKEFFTTALDGKGYLMNYYDLDVIISVGYRVRSLRGTFFRRWATKTLRDHILKGYTLNYHLEQIERRFGENDKRFGAIDGRLAETEKKIDFFVRTSLPPVHGIFYEGQIFDAYEFASDLIRSAKKTIVLLD
ncbi:MAG: virulence RhuM family protein, partial [Methanomassiliicoccaceae archaeon]|nr:virulence RhuM family protein [Methanomassiliicoccaceae archaeon]